MNALVIIFAVLTFVVPALFILGDDMMWQRGDKSRK